MDKTSALANLLEQEEYQNRTVRAQKAWAAAGHQGDMLCEWQELYECTLLDEEQLARAINRKIDLLKWEIKTDTEKQISRKVLLTDLEETQDSKPLSGTIDLKQKDIEDILRFHYQTFARKVGKNLTFEILLTADPITDEIWSSIDYKEN